MRLSEEQRCAVDAGPVDLSVSAGAGSGKTRVLTARFVHAVLGVDPYPVATPEQLLTVTFTDRAAGELVERIRGSLISSGAYEESRHVQDAWISTIHSMCARILRQNAFEVGLDPHFAVADEVAAGMLAREAMEHALTDMLREDDSAIRILMETMSHADLYSAVASLHGDLRSMGATAADLRTMDADSVNATAVAISRELNEIRKRMASECETHLKTVQGNLARLDAAIEIAAAVIKGGGLAFPLALKSPSRTGRHELHDLLVDDAKAKFEELGLCAAQLAVAPMEQEVIGLLARFAEHYSRLKADRSLLDFEDLQTAVAELFDSRPDLAKRYRDRFSMVMVDEFQDTNPLQVRIAGHLSDGDLCTVGDEKQSIYAFRHADIEVFRERQRTAVNQATLQDNYRSHPLLLAFFNDLFSNQSLFGETLMHLKPARGEVEPDGWPVDVERSQVLFPTFGPGNGIDKYRAEATAVAEEFSRLRDAGIPQGDMVVLLRKVSGVAEQFAEELRKRGFDVFVASGGTYFDTTEAQEVIALLRLADNALDDEAALTVLAGRLTGASDDALYRLRERAGRRAGLWAAACEADDLPVSEDDKKAIGRVTATVTHMRRMHGAVPLRDLIIDACERLDYDLVLFGAGPDGARAWANVLKLARMAEDFQRSTPGDVGTFLDYLVLREAHATVERQATIAGDGMQAVRIMSVHAAKGLEFPVVAAASFSGEVSVGRREIRVGRHQDSLLLGMKMPPAGESDGKSGGKWSPTLAHSQLEGAARELDAEEIKRLLYVACTRAEKGLILCLSDDLSKPASDTKVPGLVRYALGLADSVPEGQELIVRTSTQGLDLAVRTVTIQAPTGSANGCAHEEEAVCADLPELQMRQDPSQQVAGYPATISYSGMNLYRRCGYRYLAERVVGVPSAMQSYGESGSSAREFGDVFHEAMRETWEQGAPDDSRLRAMLLEHGLPETESERLKAALGAFEASPLMERVRAADRLVAECPINVPVRESVLAGAIDLIAWSGEAALIVDYKTGKGELAGDEARQRYLLQGECYAFAALKAGANRVDVVFFEPERSGRMIEYSYEREDAAAIEEEIGCILDAIASGAFEPLSEYDASVCGECAIKGTLCPLTAGDAG